MFQLKLGIWNNIGKQTASQNLKMVSRALDNRFPLPGGGLEYTPLNTFRDEDVEGDDKGEFGTVIGR